MVSGNGERGDFLVILVLRRAARLFINPRAGTKSLRRDDAAERKPTLSKAGLCATPRLPRQRRRNRSSSRTNALGRLCSHSSRYDPRSDQIMAIVIDAVDDFTRSNALVNWSRNLSSGCCARCGVTGRLRRRFHRASPFDINQRV